MTKYGKGKKSAHTCFLNSSMKVFDRRVTICFKRKNSHKKASVNTVLYKKLEIFKNFLNQKNPEGNIKNKFKRISGLKLLLGFWANKPDIR